MQHESCRAIVSAADALRAEPLSQRGKETLAQIVRFANEAAGEIEYLQTCATTERPTESISDLPAVYFEAGLSRQRLQLLSILYRVRGRAVRHETLMSELYARGRLDRRGLMPGVDIGEEPKPSVLQTYVCQIRGRLDAVASVIEAAGEPTIIETIWGVGYRLVHATEKNLKFRGRTCKGYRRKRKAKANARNDIR
jgi:DNA-binding winged helix-turn-helix (wHTH) protein